MERFARGDTESSDDDFDIDESAIDELVSISYNSIMTEIKEKDTISTTLHNDIISSGGVNPNEYFHQEEEGDENLQVPEDMDNDSSEPLFMLDCVGNTNLKYKFEEDDDPESQPNEGTICSGDDDKEGKTTSTSVVALPSWSNDGDDEKSQEKTNLKKKKKVNIKRQSKYNSLTSSIDPHLEKLLPKGKTAANRLLETTKPAADPTSDIISQRQKKKLNKERRDKVCSNKWFNMKAPELTKDIKNQLSILQLREILDRKNFYKNNDRKKFPKFFQMGKVVESAADFYHARIPKKQRKATLLDEVMADADMKKYQKRKYAEIFGDAKKTKNRKKRKLVSK